jgi:Reverse transcriptase (RNA-dependent DNA polymerase)
VPTMLVYGALPSILMDKSCAHQLQRVRMRVLAAARQAAEADVARRRLREAEKHMIPTGDHEISPGDAVSVWRDGKGWVGPHQFLDRVRGTSFVLLGKERRPFPSTKVKPYPTLNEGNGEDVEDPHISSSDSAEGDNIIPEALLVIACCGRLGVDESDVFLSVESEAGKNLQPEDPRFQESILKEFRGLLQRGVFTLVQASELPRSSNILGSRFHLTIKNKAEDVVYKARLVVQGHRDAEKDSIVPEAPTLSHTSVRMILSLAAINRWPVWVKDVTMAYLQSTSPLSRDVYIRAPQRPHAVTEQLKGHVLKVVRPLYGLVDSGSYWYATYSDAFKFAGMKHTTLDECLMYKPTRQPKENNCVEPSALARRMSAIDGAAGILVDDTLLTGSPSFRTCEEEVHKQFDLSASKTGPTVRYAGMSVIQSEMGIKVTQEDYTTCLVQEKLQLVTLSDIRSIRGRMAWLANVTRPDISVLVAALSQITEENLAQSLADATSLAEKVLALLRATPNAGIRFLHLDSGPLHIVAFSDASFAGNTDQSSQLGGLVFLSNARTRHHAGPCAQQVAHLLSFFTRKSPRVCSSVFAAEALAFSATFDLAFAIANDLSSLGIEAPVTIATDSKSLFDTLLSHSATREKRLMVDISYLREAFAQEQLHDVYLVRSAANLADGLTKPLGDGVLTQVLERGSITLDIIQCLRL